MNEQVKLSARAAVQLQGGRISPRPALLLLQNNQLAMPSQQTPLSSLGLGLKRLRNDRERL